MGKVNLWHFSTFRATSPYNGLAPSGPDVVFEDDQVVKLFGILRSIEDHARVS